MMTDRRIVAATGTPVALDNDRLTGVHAATICPLTETGEIDEPGLARHVGSVARADGIAGLLINGHAGEGAMMDLDERRRVLRIARSEVPETCHLTAGITAESTQAAIREAEAAAEDGADAILLFPPTHWAMGVDAEIALCHHRAVATAAALPLILYKAPLAWGRLSYSPDLIARLCTIDEVAGIKEGAWEVSAYEELLRRVRSERPGVSVMASGDEHLLACYQIGTDGSQVSLAALFPELVTGLYDAARRGDWSQARRAHDRLYPLAREIYRREPPYLANARLKSGLHALGRIGSARMRPPMRQLSDEEGARLAAVVAAPGAGDPAPAAG